ncbi:MAG TPA: succinate dehydrogenase cytochrome b subunit [Bacteroidales bacterium]|nr:succinate dehydrogenase cytochrome b subunit [Bacteroidales bacterium]HPO65864.1 succinate dehydrogenase cytochrome b subunit [Bacteroidales bacterium]
MAKFFNSSIGKKLMMALMGLFLAVFLVVHLSINLLVLKNDGGESYQKAVEFMTSNVLIKIMEVFLFGSFALHIIYGIILQIQNWLARPVRYVKTNHSQTSFFSKYMIHTGLIIFIFLIIHFMNFYFVKLGWVAIPEGATHRHDFYNMVINLFKNPFYSWLYIIFMVLMGFHLHHAIQSAFQTMGWNHPIYTPIVKFIGVAYAILIPLGFAFIPFYVLYFF